MAETVYLSWNWRNMITIMLMAALGFAALGLGAQLWQKYRGQQAA